MFALMMNEKRFAFAWHCDDKQNNEKIFEIHSMYMQKIDRDCISKTAK